jgi:malate permease and related proteins
VPASALAVSILGFAAIVGLGVVLRSAGLVRAADSKALNAVIIYVGLPAFVFQAVHEAPLSRELLGVIGVAWAVFLATLGLSFAAAHLLGLTQQRKGAFILAASLGNTGYLGYPLTAALLGAAAVPLAVFYDVFGTVFALVLVGLPIAARYGVHGDGRVNVLRELVTFPAVIALVAALALRSVQIPVPVSDWLGLLGSMVAPLIMISVGISLRPRAITTNLREVGVIALLRLGVAPAVAAVVAVLLVGSPDAGRVAVLEAGMPSMMLAFAVGERYGLDTDLIASAIFVTTVLAAVSVPLTQLVTG